MKDLNSGVVTPKLELSSRSSLGENSPFEQAFQELLEDISLDVERANVVIPLDNTGALKTRWNKSVKQYGNSN